MINEVTLIGNVGTDPERKTTSSGSTYTQFTMATNEIFKDARGELQKHTEWHTIKVWGDKATRVYEQVQKGRKVYIKGKNQSYEHDGRRLWFVKCLTFRTLDRQQENENYGHGTRPNYSHPIK